jgi:hypothetical protein
MSSAPARTSGSSLHTARPPAAGGRSGTSSTPWIQPLVRLRTCGMCTDLRTCGMCTNLHCGRAILCPQPAVNTLLHWWCHMLQQWRLLSCTCSCGYSAFYAHQFASTVARPYWSWSVFRFFRRCNVLMRCDGALVSGIALRSCIVMHLHCRRREMRPMVRLGHGNACDVYSNVRDQCICWKFLCLQQCACRSSVQGGL